jgi:hypothetical protein
MSRFIHRRMLSDPIRNALGTALAQVAFDDVRPGNPADPRSAYLSLHLWSEQPGGFEQVFTVPTDLRELYIDLDSGARHYSATLGRRALPGSPVLDGDSQQGLGLSLPLKSGATVDVAALNRWIKYSETCYQARGITG